MVNKKIINEISKSNRGISIEKYIKISSSIFGIIIIITAIINRRRINNYLYHKIRNEIDDNNRLAEHY